MASDSQVTHPNQSTFTRLKSHQQSDTNTVLICSSDRSSTMDNDELPPLKKLKTSSIVSNGSCSSNSNNNSNITTSEGNCKALEDQPAAIARAEDQIDEPHCETPKARENKIPEAKVCPPAPKKRRTMSHDSYDHACRRSKGRSSDHPSFFSSSTSNSPSSTAAAANSSNMNSLSSAFSSTTDMATISSTSMQLPQHDYFVPPDLHALPENIQALFK